MEMPLGCGYPTVQPDGDRPVRVPESQVPVAGGALQVGSGGFREFCDRLGPGDVTGTCEGGIVALVHLGCGERRRGIACGRPIQPFVIPASDRHQVSCRLGTAPAATCRQLPIPAAEARGNPLDRLDPVAKQPGDDIDRRLSSHCPPGGVPCSGMVSIDQTRVPS